MDSLQDVIADMDLRFKSGNSVPVRVTQLTDARWAEIRAVLEAAAALQAAPEGGEVCIVCDWKDADPFPRFIEAEVVGRSVRFDWRDRADGLKELVIPTQGEAK